jgi:hypothetical protein
VHSNAYATKSPAETDNSDGHLTAIHGNSASICDSGGHGSTHSSSSNSNGDSSSNGISGSSEGSPNASRTGTSATPKGYSTESAGEQEQSRYKYHSYEIEAGFMKEEAIELFQRFYTMENQRAPEEKRKRRREKEKGSADDSEKGGR